MSRKPRPVIERVAARLAVDEETGCVNYTGSLSAGYGVIGLGGRQDGTGYVHRFIYDYIFGGIPEGLHIDHLCLNRRCCNPMHLEAVTQAENNRRAAPSRVLTACRRGHTFTDESTYIAPDGRRYCRPCRQVRKEMAA